MQRATSSNEEVLRSATAANETALRELSNRLEGVASTVDAQLTLMRNAAAEPSNDLSALTELREATAANDETLRGVTVRLDELVATVDTEVDLLRSAAADPRTNKALAEVRRVAAENQQALQDMAAANQEALKDMAAASQEALQDMTARLDGVAATVDTQMDMLASAAEEPGDAKALADLRRLTAANEKTLREVSERLDELITEGLDTGPVAPAPPLKQLEGFESMVKELREEMTQLRRRIGVRAKGSGGLGDEQLDKLADAVAFASRSLQGRFERQAARQARQHDRRSIGEGHRGRRGATAGTGPAPPASAPQSLRTARTRNRRGGPSRLGARPSVS